VVQSSHKHVDERAPLMLRLISIDRDLYASMAVDVRLHGPVTATVYAVDRICTRYRTTRRPWELGEGDGAIPVVPFDLPDGILRISFGAPSGRSRCARKTRCGLGHAHGDAPPAERVPPDGPGMASPGLSSTSSSPRSLTASARSVVLT
jgi:hypothetical protein